MEWLTCLNGISGDMVRHVRSKKTGADYARVGIEMIQNGEWAVGNILVPVAYARSYRQSGSTFVDVCLGSADTEKQVVFGKNPDGTYNQKRMEAGQIKDLYNEAKHIRAVEKEQAKIKEEQLAAMKKAHSEQNEQKASPIYLNRIPEKMIHSAHNNKTGEDYACVSVNMMRNGKQTIGNILVPFDYVKNSTKMYGQRPVPNPGYKDIYIGPSDTYKKVQFGRFPDGTYDKEYMSTGEIKVSHDEAVRDYQIKKRNAYEQMYLSATNERQDCDFGE